MSPEVPIIILILAVPTYFLVRFIFNKLKLGKGKSRKYQVILLTLIISPILYVFAISIWISIVSYYPKTQFDKVEWIENQEERYKMSGNLIKNKLLIGKTKEEVIELLGTDYFSYQENQIGYDLGTVPRLFNIDPDFLYIYFENDRVSKVEQR